MKYLILGSGFGLYGYLPAVLSKKNNTVYLEKKYKKIINSRKELTIYKNKIIWIQNYLSNLEIIDYLIIAKRPSDQVKIIKKIINKKNILKKIFLEKPIAKNPLAAKNLLNILKKKKINVSFGFIFQYTNWYKKIKNFIKENKILKLIHIHGNNYANIDNQGMPAALELTFINSKKININNEKNTNFYPIKGIDYPNIKRHKDVKLTFEN